MTARASPWNWLLLLLPGALILYLSFNSGGYFAGSTSFAALLLALALLVRIIAAEDPFAGFGLTVAIGAAALMLFGAWVLLSSSWSGSSARALIEFNRVLLYVLAVLLFGSLPRSTERVRWMVWALVAAIVAVCLAGFLTRVMPDVFKIAPAAQRERLGYPIGYWNALGLLATFGIVLASHLTCSAKEPAVVRVLSAAVLPLLATTLLFTFSRGPLAAVVVGVVVYIVLGRPRALLSGLIAGVPATAIAVVAAYDADLLASKDPITAAAAAQGHKVAQAVALCSGGAALVRLLLLWLDRWLAGLRLPSTTKRLLAGGALVAGAAAVVFVFAGTSATDRVQAQYKRFTRSEVGQTGDFRDRLTDPGINRIDIWQTSLDGFSASPTRGQGAGTFVLNWDRERPNDSDVEEGHSLYLEVLGELGLVGLVLLVLFLGALFVGVAIRVRQPARSLYAAVLAVCLVWALHAGIDWDWEVPAVTIGVLSLAAASAAVSSRRVSRPPPTWLRFAAGVACLALAVTPALVSVSQARLAASVTAYSSGDCRTAVEKAASSLDVLGNRPEPFEVAGYCYARSGRKRESISAMRAAIKRDPDNWRYRYGLALVRADAGRDPRPAARAALRRNPRDPRTKLAVASFRHGGRRAWRREAQALGPILR
jgi:hypothetical protein